MRSLQLVLTSLSPGLLGLFGTVADRVEFAPAAGLQLSARVEWGTTLTMQEFSLEMGGQVLDTAEGLEQSTLQSLLIEDEYHSVGGGRPFDFRRTYTEVQRKVDATDPSGNGSVKVSGLGMTTGPMQGHRVRFLWNEETESFEPAWAEEDRGGGLDEWLDGLEEDLSLRAFLPPGEVEEGDTWSVDAAALRFLLAPGGNLGLKGDSEEPEDGPEGGIHIKVPAVDVGEYLTVAEGNLQCQLLAFKVEGDTRLADIRIRVDVQVNSDLAEELAVDERRGQIYDMVERELSVEGEGHLRWNLDAQHLVSLEFKAEVEQGLHAEWGMDLMGDEVLIQMESLSRGEVRCSFEVE